jgi:hypothetical protein
MKDQISEAIEQLPESVPVEVREGLESLAKEMNGFLSAGGWENWPGQAQFISDRLARYASQFDTYALRGRMGRL